MISSTLVLVYPRVLCFGNKTLLRFVRPMDAGWRWVHSCWQSDPCGVQGAAFLDSWAGSDDAVTIRRGEGGGGEAARVHLAKKSYPWMEGTERGLALVLCSLCRALTWSQRLCVRGWSGTALPRGEWARAAPLAHGHLEAFGLPISCSCCREARSPLLHFPTLYSFSSHLSGGRGDTTHDFLHRDPFPNCLSGHAAAAGSQTQRGVSKRVKPLPKRRDSVVPTFPGSSDGEGALLGAVPAACPAGFTGVRGKARCHPVVRPQWGRTVPPSDRGTRRAERCCALTGGAAPGPIGASGGGWGGALRVGGGGLKVCWGRSCAPSSRSLSEHAAHRCTPFKMWPLGRGAGCSVWFALGVLTGPRRAYGRARLGLEPGKPGCSAPAGRVSLPGFRGQPHSVAFWLTPQC